MLMLFNIFGLGIMCVFLDIAHITEVAGWDDTDLDCLATFDFSRRRVTET